jgi:hypothetical protein
VLVVPLDGNEPVEQGAQVGDSAGFELHGRDRSGRAADEGGDQAVVDRPLVDDVLHVGCDVDDVSITLGRQSQFARVNGHEFGR